METASEPAVPRTVDLEELSKHTTEKDCYLLYNGKVYDITEFLDEHPGGYDIILNVTAKDATDDFDEIGHSNAAREMLDKYFLADFAGSAVRAKVPLAAAAAQSSSSASTTVSIFRAVLPLLVVLLAAYIAFGRQ